MHCADCHVYRWVFPSKGCFSFWGRQAVSAPGRWRERPSDHWRRGWGTPGCVRGGRGQGGRRWSGPWGWACNHRASCSPGLPPQRGWQCLGRRILEPVRRATEKEQRDKDITGVWLWICSGVLQDSWQSTAVSCRMKVWEQHSNSIYESKAAHLSTCTVRYQLRILARGGSVQNANTAPDVVYMNSTYEWICTHIIWTVAYVRTLCFT